ncbi:MAG: RING finger domain protein [Faunusvirus sp.]|jgi:hypothetical protein|uniref:RING finger domain protein n=1 Tax=Faunusvirus sp. TaxID=2487766 RepID=A0A3G4ZWS3_9VIRU|nr:MAG: RING finger domain protein [Faunusvirus sp.]
MTTKILIAPGKPKPVESAKYEDLQSEATIQNIPVEQHLNNTSKLSTLSCYCCKRHIGKTNEIMLGLPVTLVPTHIGDGERARQSEKDKEMNEKCKQRTDEEKDKIQQAKTENTYNPYKECDKPHAEVVPATVADIGKHRLRAMMLPGQVYLCITCRNIGQVGGEHPDFKIKVPTSDARNMVNKYTQSGFRCIRYLDEAGKNWNITDRLTIILDESQASEMNILSQFELFQGKQPGNMNKLLTAHLDTEFYRELTISILKIVPMLMRSTTEAMMKTANGDVTEIQEFESAFYNYTMILRVALYFINRYPEMTLMVKKEIYKWNMNPFAPENRQLFDNYFDVIYASQLVGISFATIRQSVMMVLFNQLTYNFPCTDTQMGKKNKIEYLRQLFSEGRNRKMIRMILYCLSFTTSLRQYTPTELVKLLDANMSGLPFDDVIKVWRDMLYCNTMINSIEPITVKDKDKELSTRQPGLWLHLGMEPKDSKDDDRQIRDHIFQFMVYVRQGVSVWQSQILPDKLVNVINRIKDDSIKIQYNIKDRSQELADIERKRKAELLETHKYYPKLDDKFGAPKISDRRCAYCKRVFSSGDELMRHLRDTDPAFLGSMHQCHRECTGTNNVFDEYSKNKYAHYKGTCKENIFTPEYVLKHKITYCPSYQCDQKDRLFTPEELIEHFAVLGIEPFWYPGRVVTDETHLDMKKLDKTIKDEKTDEKSKVTIDISNYWKNPGLCVICLSAPCAVINRPCGHVSSCTDCSDTMHKENATPACVICREPVQQTLPLDIKYIKTDQSDPINIFFCGADV